jgi:hypothetical protein
LYTAPQHRDINQQKQEVSYYLFTVITACYDNCYI